MRNRSVPEAPVIPVLAYADAGAAATWLRDALGFRVRLRIGNHRVQLHAPGGGAVIVTSGGEADSESSAPRAPFSTHSVHVRVDDLDRAFAKALAHGAGVVGAPADHPYGERQASVVDPGGHRWTLSQSIADADPADWGGEMVEPD
jgi:uncharacterized glyoxalase superfamily protein PhnB